MTSAVHSKPALEGKALLTKKITAAAATGPNSIPRDAGQCYFE